MEKSNLFFGGVPVEPDETKLKEAYPDMALHVGQIIPYAKIEKIIGVKHGTSRFKTVTTSWRDGVQLRTGHVVDPDIALSSFRVLTEEEKLEKAIRHRGKAKKQVIKGARVLTITDRNALPEAKRGMYDHEVKNIGIATAALQIRKKIQLPELENK